MGFVGNTISKGAGAVGSVGGGFFNGAKDVGGGVISGIGDLAHGNVGGALGDIGGGLVHGVGDILGGYGGALGKLGINLPDLSHLTDQFKMPDHPAPVAPDASGVNSASDSLNKALQSRLDTQANNANAIGQEAANFRQNLPGYEAGQISNATDQSKAALTNDIYNAKANANSRGMTYSGLNTQGQQEAQVKESSNLAGNIQKINSDANTLSDQKYQNAFNAQQTVANSQVDLQTAKAKQAQDSYSAALQNQQMQTEYYASLAQSAASLGGSILGMAAKALV